MIQREYIGNLDTELMEEYDKLVQQGVFHDSGARSNVIFSDDGIHAVKYPTCNNLSNNNYFLKKEYLIGMDLATNNFHVPQMYALTLGKEDRKPFLVMEKLNLIPFTCLRFFKKRKARKQFKKQIKRANNLGYHPSDIFLGLNCGWDKKYEGLYFYDFERWDGPRVDKIMAERN